MASPGNRRSASIVSAHFRSLLRAEQTDVAVMDHEGSGVVTAQITHTSWTPAERIQQLTNHQQQRYVHRQTHIHAVAPPGFCNSGEVRYVSIGGLEYEVPQSRLYCLCINVALCSTALRCICRVIRRSSMTTKAHTYYIIFGRPPIGGKLPPGGATAYMYNQQPSVITNHSTVTHTQQAVACLSDCLSLWLFFRMRYLAQWSIHRLGPSCRLPTASPGGG